jgi:hypothetical protein
MRKYILIICLIGFLKSNSQIKNDTLTNQKLINLVKSGISDVLIKKFISSASNVNFDLSTEGLIFLKQNKLSDSIILALFDKSSNPSNVKLTENRYLNNSQSNVKLIADTLLQGFKPGIYYLNPNNKKYIKLAGVKSSMQMGGRHLVVSFKLKWFYEFVGNSAQLNISTENPEFYLVTGYNIGGTIFEASRFVLINAEKNKKTRTIDIKNGFLGTKSVNGPTTFSEQDGMINIKYQEINENIYKITIDKKLQIGSYYFAPSQIIKDVSMEFFEFDIVK